MQMSCASRRNVTLVRQPEEGNVWKKRLFSIAEQSHRPFPLVAVDWHRSKWRQDWAVKHSVFTFVPLRVKSLTPLWFTSLPYQRSLGMTLSKRVDGFVLAERRSGLSSVKHAQFLPYKFSLDAVVWVNNCRRYLSLQLFYSLTEHLFPGQAGQYMPRRSDGAQLSENNTLGLIWTHFCWQNRLFVQELRPVGIIRQMEVFCSATL